MKTIKLLTMFFMLTVLAVAQSYNSTYTGSEIDNATSNVRPYKVYTALLTQTGTNAPVATVLENTLGAVSYIYDDVGSYIITATGLLTVNKTFIFGSAGTFSAGSLEATPISVNNAYIFTKFTTGNLTDNLLSVVNGSFIEIRVYP